jgi:hypothetical protein
MRALVSPLPFRKCCIKQYYNHQVARVLGGVVSLTLYPYFH